MKKSIREQISGVFFGLVVLSILLVVILNLSFMERYYLENKKDILENGFKKIEKNYENLGVGDSLRDTFSDYDLMKFVATNNLSAIIVNFNDANAPGYYINMQESDAKRLGGQIFGYIHLNQEGQKILEKKDQYVIQLNRDTSVQMDYIEICGEIDQGVAIMLRSPMESIQESIAISNRFYIMIGFIVMILGAILIHFLARRLTKPVIELTEISQRMANLDFDVRYISGGEDEIGILGENFNKMSATLEETISELKTANNELQRDIEKKEQIDEMRKEFLSNVSHELKTPIALIQGYAEGLQDNISEDPESREFYCEVIIDEANKMNQMVKKLLSLNQLEFGNDQVNMERFDLIALIHGILQSSRILAEQVGAEIIFRQGEGGPIYVWGDEFKVEEVLTNYITNAIHYVKYENKIDIRCIQEGKTVKTIVFNTGDTIPEEDLDKVWIKFYKVDKARTREYGGSGIGLSIVKAIMDSMNQKCGVKNFDNGVAFWFTLEGAENKETEQSYMK